jgi:hypothetical protein
MMFDIFICSGIRDRNDVTEIPGWMRIGKLETTSVSTVELRGVEVLKNTFLNEP